jgi:hypothetical protein
MIWRRVRSSSCGPNKKNSCNQPNSQWRQTSFQAKIRKQFFKPGTLFRRNKNALISTGFNLLGFSPHLTQAIWGATMILAIAIALARDQWMARLWLKKT